MVQNASTRYRNQSPIQYLLLYLGDCRLNEVGEPRVVNQFVEKMVENGPLSFSRGKKGEPRRIFQRSFTNATINKSLQALRAMLYLAHQEKVIAAAPSITILPEDDSSAIIPPTEEQMARLLHACEAFHEIAPLLRDVTEFTGETGLRPGEVFALTHGSVDRERNCIRIEIQGRIKVINGKPWKPKCNKFREVPLSKRAREIYDERFAAGPNGDDDLVFPNRGGAPYIRLDYAPKGAGKGFFRDAVKVAGLKGSMTFAHLRHLFAVRLLTRGVPITVVSELLGHSNIQLTVKRYGRFASDAKVKWDAMKVLDRHSASEPTDEDR